MTLTRRYWLLILAISSTTVLGAPVAPPACARTCLDSTLNNIPREGCTASDTTCLCSSDAYTLQVTQCIVSSCLNPTDSDVASNYFADVCNEAITAATTTRITTITRFITSTQSRSTNALTRSTSLTRTTTVTTSISSPAPLQTTTETPIPPVILTTTRSPTPSTNASSNAEIGKSTDQASDQQRNVITGTVVGVATLMAIFIILLVVYRRRKSIKRAGKADRHSKFIGGEVDSPSAAAHPWRATMLSFTAFAHPNTGGNEPKVNGVIEELPKYDGPAPTRPEKYMSRNGGGILSSSSAAPEILLARPFQPGPWYHQQLALPTDEYHDISSNSLRG